MPPKKDDKTDLGTDPGESNVQDGFDKTADGLEVKGPANIVDTTVLAEQDPRGDERAGVLADAPVPGIDPASNRPIAEMDGRLPRPAQDNRVIGQTPPGFDAPKPKGRTVKIRLSTKYWPKDRPEDLPPETEYVRHPGEEIDFPEDEAMDLLERGHGERVNKRA